MNNTITGNVHQILEIAEIKQGSDIFLLLKMVMFDTAVNLNGCKYSRSFLEEIAANKDDKYTGLPLVADVNKINSGKYSELTHLQDKKTGEFKTLQIGSFYKFEVTDEKDISLLIGYAKIPKRHKKVCAAILELHKSDDLRFSYEISVSDYAVIDNVKYIDKADNNFIIGLAIVSNPACVNSTSLLAASIEDEFLNIKGEEMAETKTKNADPTFENCEAYITAELDKEQILRKISQKLAPFLVNKIEGATLDKAAYSYDIRYLFNEYAIVYDYTCGTFYKITYTATDAEIVLVSCDKVTLDFIVSGMKQVATEEQNKVNEALQMRVQELETQNVSLKAELANKDIQIITIGEELTKTQAETEQYRQYKTQLDNLENEKHQAERTFKIAELRAKAEKVLDENELAEINESIETLDTNSVNAKLAAKYISTLENKKENIFSGQRVTDSISLPDGESIFDKPKANQN